ncbi:MAG: hypothetical protein V2A71_05335 [Candidatus Eisenbacteria bacterium]
MLSVNGVNGRRRVRRLIDTWMRFGEFLKTSLGREDVQRAQEEEFLKLKARIAHLLPVLTVIEKGRNVDPEALATVRDITDMLNSFTTLATPVPLTREETEQVIAQWHTIFIYLNKLDGALKDRRYGFAPRPGEAAASQSAFPRIVHHWFTRFILTLIVLGAGIALIAGLLDVTSEEAKSLGDRGVAFLLGTSPQAGRAAGADRVTVSTAQSGTVSEQAGSDSAMTSAPGGDRPGSGQAVVRPSVAAGRGSVQEKSAVPILLRPLLRQYGKHLTMIVFAAFLAGVVFLFFVRVK